MSEIELIGEYHADINTMTCAITALREELAKADPTGSFDKHMQYMRENVELKQRLTAAEQRNTELLVLLRSASIDYSSCLEAGYDRITSLGGDCDSVEKMLADNPNYARYKSALAKAAESGASE